MIAAQRAILASTSDYNTAIEGNGKHNVFTYALLDGLNKLIITKPRT
jgi:hypothetical protein